MKNEEQRFEDAFDQIMRWYKDESGRIQLSPSLEGRRKRWLSAREWMLTYKPLTDTGVVNFLMQHHGVSEPQAWRDVRDTKRFFASMEKANREFERIMLVANIKDLRTKAESLGQFKVAAQCDATLAKMGQFDKPDESDDQATGKNIELLVGFNPKLVGAKEIPNLLEQVQKFIGDKAARELMLDNADFIDANGNRLS